MSTSTSDRVRLLTAGLEAFHREDVETFMAMYREDAVHEFPFAPEGMPARVEGREAIEAWMRTVPDLLTLDGGMHDLRIHEGGDTLTAEWSSTGHFADGTPAAISYVAVVTFDGDLVAHYRDYINPSTCGPPSPPAADAGVAGRAVVEAPDDHRGRGAEGLRRARPGARIDPEDLLVHARATARRSHARRPSAPCRSSPQLDRHDLREGPPDTAPGDVAPVSY